MDGRYKADGRHVFRNPLRTDSGITMGFLVCTIGPGLPENASEEIAEALNAHMDAHPEKH